VRASQRFGGYFLAAIISIVATAAWGQDPVQVDPQHFKVAFENDPVRVVRIHYGPHEKSPTHTHPSSVEVSLTAQHVRITSPDGFVRQEDWRAGEIEWDPSETHSVENLSDAVLDTVLVEIKGGLPASERSAAGDVLATDHAHYRLEFESTCFRVLHVHFEPHGRSATHLHPGRITIMLTRYQVKFTLPNGEATERKGERGEISWFLPERHSFENLSDEPLEFALIEIWCEVPQRRAKPPSNPPDR